MNRSVELWNDKEITTTLTAPGTIRSAAGSKIWSKILGENQCEETCKQSDYFKTVRCSTGSQCNFLSTGVILVYLPMFDILLPAL